MGRARGGSSSDFPSRSSRRQKTLTHPSAASSCFNRSLLKLAADTDNVASEAFQKVVVKSAFTSPMDSEVFREGDVLEVIDKAKFEGWYYVRKESMKNEANAVRLCPSYIFDLSEFEISKLFCKTSSEPFMVPLLLSRSQQVK
mmetsp:Transcript_41359/g.130153  ORF Transcript_41359/g.130153 Transcript_41359/m.130153 type:complete len:143 (-) Transcript_41359:280-708(-)